MAEPTRIEGVRELVRAIGSIDPALRKELGQRNKAIGARIIAKSYPKPEGVGAGAGAVPRASATTNVLRIMAGGGHRESVEIDGEKRWVMQWGKRVKERRAKRPYIRKAAEADMPNVIDDYLGALLEVANKAGIESEKG